MPYVPAIRVAVHHENHLVSAGLNTVLGNECGIDLVETDAGPDVFVVDFMRGLAIAGRRPRTDCQARTAGRVLVVAAEDKEEDIRRALQAGVDGFLELGCALEDLVGGVRQIASGARFLSSIAAGRIAASLGHATLTHRECDVLAFVARGHSNKEISKVLLISVSTVKVHMKSIMLKLGARTRTEAARIAVDRGLAS